MKPIKLAIGSPVYEEVYQYSKKKTKKVIKDECKKHLILRFSARIFDKNRSEELLAQAISHFAAFTGCTEVVNLDSVPWGEQSTFDEETYVFKGAFCIPKDFDSVEEQKLLIGQQCMKLEREMNRLARPIPCPEDDIDTEGVFEW